MCMISRIMTSADLGENPEINTYTLHDYIYKVRRGQPHHHQTSNEINSNDAILLSYIVYTVFFVRFGIFTNLVKMITRVLLCETNRKKNNMGEKQQTTIIIGLTTYAKKYYDTTVDIHVSLGENVKCNL